MFFISWHHKFVESQVCTRSRCRAWVAQSTKQVWCVQYMCFSGMLTPPAYRHLIPTAIYVSAWFLHLQRSGSNLLHAPIDYLRSILRYGANLSMLIGLELMACELNFWQGRMHCKPPFACGLFFHDYIWGNRRQSINIAVDIGIPSRAFLDPL